MRKVVKFGGSSLASAEQFKKVGDIIRADKGRKYVVPSAPGKRFDGDIKVTDMLYACYAKAEKKEDITASIAAIRERYMEIINGLGLSLSLDDQFEVISENFKKLAGSNYAASRGEYLNGIIMANYLGYKFIDAAEVIVFHYMQYVGKARIEMKARIIFACMNLKKLAKILEKRGWNATTFSYFGIRIRRKSIVKENVGLGIPPSTKFVYSLIRQKLSDFRL